MPATPSSNRRNPPAVSQRMLEEAGVRTDRHLQSQELELFDLWTVKPVRLPWHVHENAHFSFLAKGSMKWATRARQHDARPWHGTFHPPGIEHSVSVGPGSRCYTLVLGDRWIQRLREHAPVPSAPATLGPDSRWSAMRLFAELRRLRPGSLLVIEGLTMELLAAAARAALEPEQRAPAWLEDLLSRLRTQFVRPPRLADLAVELRLHPGVLSRTFRHFTGRTYGSFMRELRIERFLQELEQSKASIAELAAKVGYADASHCVREFRRIAGTTPAEYRRALVGPAKP